jgi:hypothetical protein
MVPLFQLFSFLLFIFAPLHNTVKLLSILKADYALLISILGSVKKKFSSIASSKHFVLQKDQQQYRTT